MGATSKFEEETFSAEHIELSIESIICVVQYDNSIKYERKSNLPV